MQLNQLNAPKGAHKRRKIVGRGQGSGHGKTSCRGHDGTGQRPGKGLLLSSEGGQMPLLKRLPKVGFNSKQPIVYQVVNLETLRRIKEGAVVDGEYLKQHGFIKSLAKPFKILGEGELSKPLTIRAHSFSKSAQEKIIKAGGKAETIPRSVIAAQEAQGKKGASDA